MKWKMSFEKEEEYISKLKEIAKSIISNSFFPKEFHKSLGYLSDIVYSYNLDDVVHTKKDNFKKKDIMEALRKVNEILTWIFYKK